MERRFQKEIETVKKTVIEMGTLVEEAVQRAADSFLNRDVELAHKVVEGDERIDALEIAIDRQVFQYIALKQPVAKDLRFLFSADKINKDLERLGDHAVNIAQATICYASQSHILNATQLTTMFSVAKNMVSDALTAFIQGDSQLALKVLERDDQVDTLNHVTTRDLIEMVKQDVTNVEAAMELIKVTKNLERMGDLATNIAEDVIFNAQARDVKHHSEDDSVARGEEPDR